MTAYANQPIKIQTAGKKRKSFEKFHYCALVVTKVERMTLTSKSYVPSLADTEEDLFLSIMKYETFGIRKTQLCRANCMTSASKQNRLIFLLH
jgi:hypothetical protein